MISENKIQNVIKSSDFDIDLIRELSKIEEAKSILACFQCGMCTSSCPIAEQFPLNPHEMTKLAVLGVKNQILDENVLKFCLTCRTCQESCPQNIDFIEFIKSARRLLVSLGIKYKETHHGIVALISELQANHSPGLKLPSDLAPKKYQKSKKRKIAYFFGCLPILDVIFDNLQLNLVEIAKNGIKILTEVLKQPPVIIENMKCCGHDALWKGHFDIFKKLAIHNVNEINKLGIKTLITTCAECYRTLKIDYPKYVNANFEVIHLTELIVNKIKNNQLEFLDSPNQAVTYHDPCRLGRHMKFYSPPREILNSMKEYGIDFNEMQRIKENSMCCGVSCFINCNDLSKALQLDRIKEAKSVADLLVTTCPKCQIHYSCMLQEKKEHKADEIKLEITDITNLIANMMKTSDEKKEELLLAQKDMRG
ncbi:MAG: (Fe-S)-binding protein [Candidatus Heimdallarchaeota archaeon]